MKIRILIAVAFCCAQTTIAQPMLTAAMNNPVPGETFNGHSCDTAGINAGAAGASVTWDFSALSATSLDTTNYISCSGAMPPCSDFTGSNLVSGDSTNGFIYYISDTDVLAFNGEYEATLGELTGTDPETLIRYPFTYASSLVDSFSFSGVTVPITLSGVDSSYADGYGTLILPSGTYTNVLRIHLIMHDTISFSGSLNPEYINSYLWYTPGFHNLLLNIYYSTSSTVADPSKVIYYTRMPTTGIAVQPAVDALNIFPNPATSELHVQLTGSMNTEATITLMDMTGRTIEIQAHTGNAGDVVFNVATLPAQMYMVRVQAGTQTMLRKVAVSR